MFVSSVIHKRKFFHGLDKATSFISCQFIGVHCRTAALLSFAVCESKDLKDELKKCRFGKKPIV